MTDPAVRSLRTEELTGAQLAELRSMFDESWADDGSTGSTDDGFTDDDWAHAIGGTHFVIEAGGSIRSHASVVDRELVADGRMLATGYVEAVATRPGARGRGYAGALMRAVTELIDDRFELGALGTDLFGFYRRFGWEVWRGPTAVRVGDGTVRTPDEDGLIMIRRTPSTPALDLDSPISCDWRPGDVW